MRVDDHNSIPYEKGSDIAPACWWTLVLISLVNTNLINFQSFLLLFKILDKP